MVLEQLAVILNSPEVSSGDVLVGKVVVGLYSHQKIRGIYVELKGESEVSWSESESQRNSEGQSETVWVTYGDRQTHLDERVSLVGGAGHQLLLPAGEHVYHFQLPLPQRIPPSFEGDHGHVRYRLKATVEKSSAWGDEAVAPVVVLAAVDLNLQPALKEPTTQLKEKTLCCLCCRSGPLTLLVQTPSTGYVPGERVSVTVEVDNATGTRVDGVVCQLLQKILYHARNPSRKSKKTESKMASVEFGSVEAHGSATWTRVLQLPWQLPPSGLPHCSSVIELSYCLTVKAEVPGPHINPTVEIPVIVGTVPLRAMATSQVAAPSAPPLASQVPPPSYTESVYGGGKQPTSYLPSSQIKYDRFQ